MNNKNFVNFHVLISHSPSCLNRDDMNMQKTAVFGGTNRVRVSSQSQKRAMRTSDYYAQHLGKRSIRTRDLENLIPIFKEQLKDEFDSSLITKTMELFVREKSTDEESADHDEINDASGGAQKSEEKHKKLAVAPWSVAEIRALCSIIKDVALTDEEIEKAKLTATKQKSKKRRSEQEFIDDALTKKRVKAVNEKIAQVRQAIGEAVDIALSGRMATSGLMTSVDGAMAIAHAITTHAVEPQEVDWFTAVDDLTSEAGETGAGHLDTQQFSSGVFYRYASLNLKQLQVNMGLIDNIKSEETEASRTKALEIARHVLHLLVTVVPSAKQQSFAAHNLADFALVSFSDQPISLANAFESPIRRDRNGGFIKPSVDALAEYWARINAAYGLDEIARAFAVQGDVNMANKPVATLTELESWVASGGQA